MPTGAVVRLEGEFVLATDYGANPMTLGIDLDNHSKDVRGIIRAARLWEISYLMRGHVEQARRLVPEMRFADKGRKERFVAYVLDGSEAYNGEPFVEYDLRGQKVYVKPATIGIEEALLDDVLSELQMRRSRANISIHKSLEIAIKYRDLVNHIASIPKYQSASAEIRKFLGFIEEDEKSNRFCLIVQDAAAKAVAEAYSEKENPESSYVRQRIIEGYKKLFAVIEDPKYRGILEKLIAAEQECTSFEIDSIEHLRYALQSDIDDAKTVQELLPEGLDEDFLTAFTEIGKVEWYAQIEILRRMLLR